MKLWVILGSLNAFLAVGLGAMGAHAIKGPADRIDEMKETFQSANRYHFYAALGLILIGLLSDRLHDTGVLTAGVCIGVGMVMFCTPVYFMGMTGNRLAPFPIAPFGGVLMMIGWLALAVTAWMAR